MRKNKGRNIRFRARKIIETFLECEICGNKTSIQRRMANQKKKGHIKHLYCYKCKERTPHIELK